MITRDEDIFTAKTKYKLKPIAYEVPYTSTDPTTSPILKSEYYTTIDVHEAHSWLQKEWSTTPYCPNMILPSKKNPTSLLKLS